MALRFIDKVWWNLHNYYTYIQRRRAAESAENNISLFMSRRRRRRIERIGG